MCQTAGQLASLPDKYYGPDSEIFYFFGQSCIHVPLGVAA